jgi:hypothetical protein
MDPIINHRRLDQEAPDWRKLELDYRPDVSIKAEQVNLTVFLLATIYVAAAAMSLTTAAQDLPIQVSMIGFMYALSGFLPWIALAMLIQSRGDWRTVLTRCLGMYFGAIWIGFLLQLAAWRELSFFVYAAVLLVVIHFADRFVKHFYLWLSASHRVPPEVRRQRLDWFRKRYWPSGIAEARRQYRAEETRLREAGDVDAAKSAALCAQEAKCFSEYRRGIVLAAALYLVIPYVHVVMPFMYSPTFSMLLLFAVPPAVAYLRLRRLVPGGARLRRLFMVLGRATVSWFNYGQYTEDVPGVFISQAGPRIWRAVLAFAAFALLPTVFVYIIDSHYNIAVSILLAVFVAPVCFFTIVVLVAGPVLMLAFEAQRALPELVDHGGAVTDWEAYVRRLMASKTPMEAEHLWLGIHPIDDFPLLLHRDILQEHAYIVGDSGSGKTALGVAPLVTQLIRQRHAAVVILDLKGDASLFQAARIEAEQAGAEFKYFTNELNRATYIFNPFGLADSQHISLNQLCEIFLEALSLNHGEGYGRSYFSRLARHWLAGALRKNPNLESFEELYEYTRRKGAFQNAEERERVFELISVIESLATFEQLNLTPARAKDNDQAAQNAIRMDEVIREKQVVYFWLPAAVEAATVREIAKLALYSLMNAAYFIDRASVQPGDEAGGVEAPAGTAQTYLVIDEFQRIASGNFKIILEQARSMGIGAILANQTFADLVTPESDLRPTVESNTRLKLCFSATDLDQQDRIIKASGETKDWQFGYNSTPQGLSFNFRQQVVPRIRRNNIIEIGDDPFLAVCQIVRGSGYSQYSGYSVPVRTSHAITKHEYRRRMTSPWPAQSERTITVRRAPLPEMPFPSVEARLEAAQKIPVEPEKRKTKAAPDAPADTTSAWSARLNQLRDAYYAPEGPLKAQPSD